MNTKKEALAKKMGSGIYRVNTVSGSLDTHVRANNMNHAREIAKKQFPHVGNEQIRVGKTQGSKYGKNKSSVD